MIPKFDPWSALEWAHVGAKAAKPAKATRDFSHFSTISTSSLAEPGAVGEHDRGFGAGREPIPLGSADPPPDRESESTADRVSAALERWQAEIEAMASNNSDSPLRAQLICDARLFFQSGWARNAAALGWDELSLFGVHPSAPEARLDCRGLVPALAGRRICALSDMSASIDAGDGALLTVYRGTINSYGEAVPIWELDLP